MTCGAVAVLAVAGCASSATSPSPLPTTAASWACSAQPPGCGSPQGTAQSLAGFTWSAAPAPPLSPRTGQASVWTGTELLIWGGSGETQGQAEADDGAAYDPVTRAWTPMPASPLSPRDSAFAVWTGTRALFWGGETGPAGSLLRNGASYDPASRTWAMLPAAPLPPDPDGPQAIVWTGTQMVVIQPGADAAFDPVTNSWTTVPVLPAYTSDYGTDWAEWTGSEVIAWAGGPAQAGAVRLSAYSWVPGSEAWTSLPGQPGDGWPFGTAASIGGRLLFLGGVMPCGVACPAPSFGNGDWFDPSSGTWNSLPVRYAGDFGPAVWTGSAMVVLATKADASPGLPYGPRRGPPVPAGAAAAFNPSTGTWTDLARCPVPDWPDLTNASLAWTGRQLIVVTWDNESNGTPQVEVLSSAGRNSTQQR
jgi:hypothetical protein